MPYAYCYRCPYNLAHPECAVECARSMETVFKRHIEAESVAAVIFEPVPGEGGFVPRRPTGFRLFNARAGSREFSSSPIDPDWILPHRASLCVRTVRHRTRSDFDRQINCRRLAAGGRDGPPKSWIRPNLAGWAAHSAETLWRARRHSKFSRESISFAFRSAQSELAGCSSRSRESGQDDSP
jgi:hypothetical protein